jgi:hypothetical protein
MSVNWLMLVIVLPAFISSFAVGVVMILGAVKMMRLESHRWAMAASILAMLPCGPASILGMAAGVWSLIVLNRRNVAAAFAAQKRNRASGPGAD